MSKNQLSNLKVINRFIYDDGSQKFQLKCFNSDGKNDKLITIDVNTFIAFTQIFNYQTIISAQEKGFIVLTYNIKTDDNN